MSPMKFCREYNNLLYLKEDKEQKILLYACRHCDYQEAADNNCVYRMEASGPTLPPTKGASCSTPQHREPVFFQYGNTIENLREALCSLLVNVYQTDVKRSKELDLKLVAKKQRANQMTSTLTTLENDILNCRNEINVMEGRIVDQNKNLEASIQFLTASYVKIAFSKEKLANITEMINSKKMELKKIGEVAMVERAEIHEMGHKLAQLLQREERRELGL